MASLNSLATGLEYNETRARAGIAEEEFDSLVRMHQQKIYRVLLSVTRNIDTAENLTQECFLRAFERRASFRGDSSIATWLTRIALNLAHDHGRNRRNQFWKQIFGKQSSGKNDASHESTPSGQEVESIPDQHGSAERALLAKEKVASMLSAVGELPEQQRTVFTLRFLEEMPLEEIAQSTGLGINTVKTHLLRGTIAVRKRLLSMQTRSANGPADGSQS